MSLFGSKLNRGEPRHSPGMELIRFHQPVGTLLLIWPPLWCLMLLSDSLPPLGMVAAFILGAFCMRSAGCVINDITDRKLDALVERTKDRPLASGAMTVAQAWWVFAVLMFGALLAAISLGWPVVYAAMWAVPLVMVYPWMKRITYWPQLFLGITFNYGVLLASIALTGSIQPAAWWLYAACIFWTLGYDTIYGFQDMADDEKVGIKSTSRKFKRTAKMAIGLAYGLCLTCLMMVGAILELGEPFAATLFVMAVHFIWQVYRLDIQDAEGCKQLFKSNGTLLGAAVLFLLCVI